MPQKLFWLILASLLWTAACGSSTPDGPQIIINTPAAGSVTAVAPPPTTGEGGYPNPLTSADSAYPAPTLEGILTDLPQTPEELPEPEAGFATVSGAVVSPIEGQGFLPVTPRSITLGQIVTDNQGRPTFLRSSDNGTQAQLFGAGVFIFNGVEPGRYGIVLDLGYGVFPITLEDSEEIFLFDVEAGESLDLGVLFFPLP
jgi:hypothetical protein